MPPEQDVPALLREAKKLARQWTHEARYAEIAEAVGDEVTASFSRDAIATATTLRALAALVEAQQAENKRLREALVRCGDILANMERVPMPDGEDISAVRALGEQIGYGCLMATASALWRERLQHMGYPVGGEFCVGPCRSTALSLLAQARAALREGGTP